MDHGSVELISSSVTPAFFGNRVETVDYKGVARLEVGVVNRGGRIANQGRERPDIDTFLLRNLW